MTSSVDIQDRPDRQSSLERAAAALASVGPRVVAHLLELMQGSDMKRHFYLARTLGVIGEMFEALFRALGDLHPGLRAKASAAWAR